MPKMLGLKAKIFNLKKLNNITYTWLIIEETFIVFKVWIKSKIPTQKTDYLCFNCKLILFNRVLFIFTKKNLKSLFPILIYWKKITENHCFLYNFLFKPWKVLIPIAFILQKYQSRKVKNNATPLLPFCFKTKLVSTKRSCEIKSHSNRTSKFSLWTLETSFQRKVTIRTSPSFLWNKANEKIPRLSPLVSWQGCFVSQLFGLQLIPVAFIATTCKPVRRELPYLGTYLSEPDFYFRPNPTRQE